ncbi:SLC13 family permease [Desulfovibrio piger]|uniref:Di-and tricarboxylate transporter n=3 Tax=Desulfovibrio piger TaxID=901 RepID=A0A1K1LFD8_9BACT|nr:DASS family sodium-coupled anion symporter [Desulfovibrio piger]SFV72150.1 di-and tricarboxylate transporter [Desulfovibrio piger]
MFAMPGKLSALFTLYNVERWFGLLGGTLLLLFTVFADPWFGLPPTAWHCLGLVLLMAVWWATEAVPLPVTALLPIIFLPMLGLCNVKASTAPYAHPTIYLFFGGFLLGLAMEKCNLHKRIALLILSKVGSCPRMQIAGFMFATGFISMWVSNTATAIMMLPIGISVASVVTQGQDAGEAKRFSCALMLAIAYSSSIGGMGTLIGTPPNALLRAFLAEHYHIHIGFGQWMLLGVPVAVALSLFTWWWLTRKPFNFAGNTVHEKIRQELEALGPVSREEAMTACLFGCAALCWVLQPIISRALPFVDDTFIAMCFGLLLFVMPVDMGKRQFLMNWQEARKLPWGILLLFGGGLSLAGAINSTGLASWMANVLGSLQGIPFILMTFILVITVQIMTEFTSNTATSAAFLPLVGIMAVAQGIEPAIYAIPAALAASCAFMLPVSTPPNAIVFRSGALTIPDMLRAGFALTLASGVIITLLVWLLVPLVFV